MKHLNSLECWRFWWEPNMLSFGRVRREMSRYSWTTATLYMTTELWPWTSGATSSGMQSTSTAEMSGFGNGCHFPIFLSWFSRQDPLEKVKYVFQTNHLGCPAAHLQLLQAKDPGQGLAETFPGVHCKAVPPPACLWGAIRCNWWLTSVVTSAE